MLGRGMTNDRSGYLPALRFAALTRFYDPLIAVTTREAAFKARLVALAALADGERALDVGCGTGTLALALARCRPAARIAGVDADDAMLERARAKSTRAGARLELRRAMAQDLPFADATFDVVVSSLFFHHLLRPAKAQVAAELVRVLRPGGRMVVADWGAPGGPIMRLAAAQVRLLDGDAPTRDNLAGRLPAIFADAGFADVAERDSLRTAFGRIVLVTGRRPPAPS